MRLQGPTPLMDQETDQIPFLGVPKSEWLTSNCALTSPDPTTAMMSRVPQSANALRQLRI